MSIQNPHDRFFRESFGRPQIARDYLQTYLPTGVSRLLDLNQLELQDSTFLDKTLQEHQTDLLYQVQLTTGQPAYLYFLFEHKSYPDPLVGLQLLRYMVRLWERQAKENRRLAPIIPVVIYHGETTWQIATHFRTLLEAPEDLHPYLPTFSYHLSDFSYLSDEAIQGEIWLRVALSVLRAISNPHLSADLEKLIPLILKLEQQETGLEYIRTVLYYLTKGTERVSRQDLEQVLLQQGEQGEALMATIAQEYIQEGFAKGMEQGVLKAKREMARQLLTLHDIATVSRITGLSLAELQKLANEIDGGKAEFF